MEVMEISSDAEESRTTIPRKRTRLTAEDKNSDTEIIDLISREPSEERSPEHKRAKQEVLGGSGEEVEADLLVSKTAVSTPQWNKGVQTGLRTSFGAKKSKPPPKPTRVLLQEDSDVELLDEAGFPHDSQQRPVSSGSEAALVNAASSPPGQALAISTIQAAPSQVGDVVTSPLEGTSHESGEVSDQSSDGGAAVEEPAPTKHYQMPAVATLTGEPGSSLAAAASAEPKPVSILEAQFDSEDTEVDKPYKPTQLAKGKQKISSGANAIVIPNGTLQLTAILRDDGTLVPPDELHFQDFVYHFLKTNPQLGMTINASQIKDYFYQYHRVHFSEFSNRVRRWSRNSALGSVATNDAIVLDAQRAVQNNTPLTFAVKRRKSSQANRNAAPSMEDDTLVDPNLPDEAAAEDKIAPPMDDAMSVDDVSPIDYEKSVNGSDSVGGPSVETITAAELAMQHKYFPTANGIITIVRCLMCGDTTHSTMDCEALSCDSCKMVGDHTTMACNLMQRCSKCRERGHAIGACPEKLYIGRDEIVCDLCQSRSHIETACDLVWRTFYPKAEDIKRVKSITVSCYFCGGLGHYGPDCGLKAGNRWSPCDSTWSRLNYETYVDPSSNAVAISAPKDYSIPARSTKGSQLSIKGKANNAIEYVESDDEDVSFIRPKEANNPRQAKTFGKIGINLSERITPVPAIRPSQSVYRGQEHRSNPPRTGLRSSRHMRENNVSPPSPPPTNNPQGFANQFPPGRDMQGAGYYQMAPPPPPPNYNYYQQAPPPPPPAYYPGAAQQPLPGQPPLPPPS